MFDRSDAGYFKRWPIPAASDWSRVDRGAVSLPRRQKQVAAANQQQTAKVDAIHEAVQRLGDRG